MKWHFEMKTNHSSNLVNLDQSDRRYKKDDDGNVKLKRVNNSTLPPHIPQTDIAEKKQSVKVEY